MEAKQELFLGYGDQCGVGLGSAATSSVITVSTVWSSMMKDIGLPSEPYTPSSKLGQ